MKERLDVLVVKGGFAPSREKAKAIIMCGSVFVDGQREDKAGTLFDPDKARIEVKGGGQKYVSRGGLKLEKAIGRFGISLEGMVCMDIGASTGGFTDCMLQNGAAKVYAVDVGHGQLAWKLRSHEKVVCLEKTNFRFMQPGDIEDTPDFASVDVSFISLTKILLPARTLLKAQGELVCLVKPQFEAGREKVGKKGVVREGKVHEEVVRKIADYADYIGFSILHLDFSPIKGPEGNIEYLIHLRKDPEKAKATENIKEQEAENALLGIMEEKRGYSWQEDISAQIRETVRNAHQQLDGE